jgi:uncharacterized protein
MTQLQQVVDDFLAQRRIAVAGVSRNSASAANAIYRKLKGAGYEVFPINPKTGIVEGDRCYASVKAVPDGVQGVVIATPPEVAVEIVDECADLGISRVWMHRSFGAGSVSETAAARGRERGLTVIAGACPMMYCKPVDFGHRCIRAVLKLTGGLPKP